MGVKKGNSLINKYGKEISLETLRGNIVIVDLFYVLHKFIRLDISNPLYYILEVINLIETILSTLRGKVKVQSVESVVYKSSLNNVLNDKVFNFHTYNISSTFSINKQKQKKFLTYFDKLCDEFNNSNKPNVCADTSTEPILTISSITNDLYEKGYSGLDIITYLENSNNFDVIHKYQMILLFNKLKKDFRNEKLFILFILNFILLRSECDLENISFM